ncbi:MAG: DUF4838 domain-containing protein, partial [Planctomycetota bacterium]
MNMKIQLTAITISMIIFLSGSIFCGDIAMIENDGSTLPVKAIIDRSDYPARIEKAGSILQKYLNELFSVKLPVNPAKLSGSKVSSIIVGKKAAIASGYISEKELQEQGFNGFIIKTINGSFIIAGDSIQGTIYGAYKFLEKQGLKFYDRNCFIKKPANKNGLIPLQLSDKPFFEGKRITAPFCIYGDSSSGFSLGDPRIAGIDKEYPCDRTLWIDHTAAFLVPKKLYLKSNPEYYILRGDGKRLPADTTDVRLMLCQTNKGGIKIAVKRALAWIEKQKDRKYFVIQQGDDMEACMCKNCNARRKEGWNESDLMLNWVNSIAAGIAKKYPDKRLLCYAYVSTQLPPNKLKLAGNVQLLYAPWPNKISAPDGFHDFDSPENIIAHDEIKGWIKQCGAENLGLYDYNSGHVLTLRGMADRVKWCAENGMKGGLWYCGTPKIFQKLFLYVHSQLNWDPHQDTTKLERDFIHAYYGKAAPAMEKIISSIYNRLDDDKNNKR